MPKYRVTSPHAVHGHAPGEEFDAELDPAHERRLLIGGHIDYVPEVSDGPTEEPTCLDCESGPCMCPELCATEDEG